MIENRLNFDLFELNFEGINVLYYFDLFSIRIIHFNFNTLLFAFIIIHH